VASSLYARGGKRTLDLVLALAALAALSPLWLLVALLVRLDSRGPVFYRQERIGRGGRPFRLFKFRSMVVGAEKKGAGILVERDDPRITRLGRVLRKLSLDEIPQLFNVVLGDMSLVGPRPGLRYQVEQYDEVQRRRLEVRPGVTGWAQVHGRNSIDWGRRIELDLEYIDRLSLATDVIVLLKTIPSVLRGEDQIAARDYWLEKARAREGRGAEPRDGGGGAHAG
jgi:lipopolysaccharide/colanic/teichoic acid biosynthesis glycosyltransferase